jgi:hypothetical protein
MSDEKGTTSGPGDLFLTEDAWEIRVDSPRGEMQHGMTFIATEIWPASPDDPQSLPWCEPCHGWHRDGEHAGGEA